MIEEILHKLFASLSKEGLQIPTEIHFPKKTYDRIEWEVNEKCKYHSTASLPMQEIQYHYASGSVKIKKSICPTCGE